MLEIEYEPPSDSDPCDCCGARTTSLTRFVLRDGDAFAVVYLSFSESHPKREVWAAISAGKWWDGCGPDDRETFSLILRAGPENYEVSVSDPDGSPWRDVELIGRKLTRDQALEHPLIDEIFHVTDHLFGGDEALLSYLDAPAP